MKPRRLNVARLSFPLAAALATLFAVSFTSAQSTYTWTNTTTGAQSWTTAGNWSSSTQYVSDAANQLMFFTDSTTNIAPINQTFTNVPATLAMNTLTLNGKGATSGASSSSITVGTGSTWAIGDGTTSTVNLNANAGASTAASIFYNVAANLTLNQATTLFTGNGNAGVHNNAGNGFLFSGNIGQAAAGYGITKSGSSRLTLSGSSLTFTGDMTVNGGMLILTGNSNPGFAMTVNTGAILRIGNNTATQLSSGNYAGDISTGTGGTLQLWSTSAQEFSGIISGSGGIQKAYGGQLTLSGANTYTGKTQFLPQTTAGFTVKVSSFNSVVGGTASSSLGAPTTVANGTIDLGSGSAQAGVNLIYEANAGGTATGETTDRVINIGFNGTSDRTITANNASGVLRFTSAFTSNGGGQNGKLILTGTGAGQIDQGLPQLAALGLDKQGSGTWTLGGSGNFTGPTKINGGLLSLSSATALQFSPFDTTSVAGTATAGLKIATTTLSLGGLTGGNALDSRFTTVSGGYSGLTALTLTNAANTVSTYSGAIAEGATGMTLTKTGGGTQFLTGTIGYTGSTTVNAGTLGSNGTFSGAVTVNTGATLSPGASAGAFGTITISDASASALTLNGGNLLMDVSTASNDLIAVTGNTVLNGTNTVFLNPTTGVAAGTYNLVTSAATTGSGSVVFANGSTTLGDATLAVSAGNIQMTVGAGGLNHSVWVGTTATWDSGTNWNRNGTPASAFVAGDWVTINDTGSNAAAITSAAAVSPAALTVNNSSKAFIINANIGGTGTPLIKSGTNTLTLGGTNTYSGGTVINQGILSVNSNDRLGNASGGITLAGGQLLGNGFNYSMTRSVTVNGTGSSMRVGRNNNITTSGALTGSGAIAFVDNGGAGSLSLYRFTSSGNTFTGAMTLGAVDVRVSSLGDTLGNNLIFTGAGTFSLNDTGATSVLSFSNRAIELSNSNGTIQNNNTTHAITIGSNLVATGAGAKTLTLSAAAGPINVFSGNITNGSGGGNVAVSKAGAGTWTLSGANTHSGGTTLTVGALRINHATALGTGAFIIGGNGTFDNITGGSLTVANPLTMSGGSPTFTGTNAMTITGPVTISGITAGSTRTITVSAGSLTLSNDITESVPGLGLTKGGAGTITLSSVNSSFTGLVVLAGGITNVTKLADIGGNSSLGAGNAAYPIRINSGTMNYTGVGGDTTNRTIEMAAAAAINNNGSGTIAFTAANVTQTGTASARTLTLGGSYTGGANTFGSIIGNSGTGANLTSLVKNGNSTWILSNGNTYTGTTTVSAGTLSVTGSLGATAVSVNAGTLAGNGNIGGNVTIAADATHSLAVAATPGAQVTRAITGTLTLTAGNILDLTAAATPAAGEYVLATATTAITGTPTTINYNGINGTVTVDTVSSPQRLLLTVSGDDMTPPTLTSITDNVSGGPVDIGATINYTVTFDEDIDAASVTTADFDNNGTAGITVVSTNETSPGVFTVAVTATSPGSLKLRIPTGAVIEDVAGNDLVVPVEDDTTIIVRTLYATWAASFLPTDVSGPAGNNDGDGFNNLLEYAFGTNPTVSDSVPMVYTPGGDVTTPGQPILLEEGGTYYAVFGRRKDYVAAGLTYTVQFSADLTPAYWYNSPTAPTLVSGDPSAGDIDAVRVPFPGLIPTDSGPKKATFFRLNVTIDP